MQIKRAEIQRRLNAVRCPRFCPEAARTMFFCVDTLMRRESPPPKTDRAQNNDIGRAMSMI